MRFFKNLSLLFLAVLLLTNCKSKKKPSLSGEDPVEVSDFIDFFHEYSPPFQFTDTSLLKKENDSFLISYKVLTQFVPDSTAGRFFGKGMKPKIYPVGKLKVPGTGMYIFIKTVSGDKRSAFVLIFDKKNKLADMLPVLQPDASPATKQSVSVDRSYTINKIVTRKNPDGSTSDGSDVYSTDKETGKLVLIQTNKLDDRVTELVNPIDAFSRKNKYSADYGSGKMNLVSIRDGRKSDRLSFFVHFENKSGDCSGELKGEAILKTATTAEYREGGDPCVLRFSFTSSSVTLKEVEGCGSHRDLRCSFDGSFSRKKEAKPKVAAKKK